MNSNDRAGSVITALIVGAISFIVLTISSCVQHKNDNTTKLRLACMEQQGTWAVVNPKEALVHQDVGCVK